MDETDPRELYLFKKTKQVKKMIESIELIGCAMHQLSGLQSIMSRSKKNFIRSAEEKGEIIQSCDLELYRKCVSNLRGSCAGFECALDKVNKE